MKRIIVIAVTFVAALLACATSASAFRDDFTTQDTSTWTFDQNDGSVYINNGALVLTKGSQYGRFPYVYMNSDPFPSTGDFVLKMRVQFTQITPWGVGIAATTRTPIDDTNYDAEHIAVFKYWADNLHSTPGTGWHDLEYDYSESGIRTYMDGVAVANTSSDAGASMQVWSLDRPHSLWMGNPTWPASSTWTDLKIDYIEVDPVPEPCSIMGLVAGFSALAGMFIAKKR